MVKTKEGMLITDPQVLADQLAFRLRRPVSLDELAAAVESLDRQDNKTLPGKDQETPSSSGSPAY